MTFCVLLSAYNGEKYITEQLDSIFLQEATDIDIKVLVRDDGSKDGTIEICENYVKENNVDIQVIRGKNIGPANSFLDLIKVCPLYDYYAFCDQDDVWLPGKVRASIAKLNNEKPVMWLSNYDVVDSNLKVIKEHVLDEPETDPFRILFYNNVPGCVMVFNKALMLEMKKMNLAEFRMHDIFALNMVAQFGTVYYNKKSFLLYRQHENNALGFGNKAIDVKSWISEKIKYLKSDESYHICEYSSRMLEQFSERLTEKQVKEYNRIRYYNKSIVSVLRLLNQSYTKNGINRTAASIRTKILLRRF